MVTQEQIARELGVSRQLVTFALAGNTNVSAKSRARILETAEKMGYRPNLFARALKRSATGIVSLWIPNQISSYYLAVTRELSRLARQARKELIVSEFGPSGPEQVLSHVPVDGRFIMDVPEQSSVYKECSQGQTPPVVSMGGHCNEEADFVKVDLLAGTHAAMQHLLDAGYRRIAHATLVTEDSPQASRRQGYREAMAQAGLTPEFIYYPYVEQLRPILRRLIPRYVREHGRPDAIFCHSDDAAIAVYRALRDLKLRIPQDVALVGCDGIIDTEYLDSPLTTIVQPVEKMCATAWEFMERRLADSALPKQKAVLKPGLVVRESSDITADTTPASSEEPDTSPS